MEHTHLHFKKLLDELSILFPHRNLVLKRWEEEERTNPTCVWVQAHVHTQKSNPLKVPESFTYLTLLNAPLSSSSFLKRPRQTQPTRQLFKPLFTMFTGENKKLAQAELAVHSLHRQPRREALLHVSKTSHSAPGGVGRPGELVPLPAFNKPPSAGCGAEEFLISCTHTPPPRSCIHTLAHKHSHTRFQKWATKSRVCLAELIPALCAL